eukprot:jgi/Tetstr1/436648/TSEL_025443.t1
MAADRRSIPSPLSGGRPAERRGPLLVACLLLAGLPAWFALSGLRDRSPPGHARPLLVGPDTDDGVLPAGGSAPSWSTWLWECNATLRYAHMSMLASLPGGRLVAGWQAGHGHEGEALAGLGLVQSLYLSRSPDGGRSWSRPVRTLAGMAPLWGPVLHYERAARRLWLFYSVSTVHDSAGGDVAYRTTTDLDSDAPVWSPPTVIWRSEDMDGHPKVTANRLEVLHDGTWVLPVWQEAPGVRLGVSSVLIGREDGSAPDGRAFTAAGRITSDAAGWLIEGSVAEVRPAGPRGGPPRLLQLFRSRDAHVWRAGSEDGGATWGRPERMAALPNPNSKVSVTRVVGASGQHGLVLAYNPSQSIRSPLVLALSRDGGAQWSDFATLESDATVPGRWYAYPTIVQHGGHVYCSYTVYDHLPEGEVVGVVDTEWRLRVCPAGADVCSIEAASDPQEEPKVIKERLLKNRFLGLKLAVVPLPSF